MLSQTNGSMRPLTFATRADLYTHLDGAWGELTDPQQQMVVDQLVHEASVDGVLLEAACIDDPARQTHDWRAWLDAVTSERVVEWLALQRTTITDADDVLVLAARMAETEGRSAPRMLLAASREHDQALLYLGHLFVQLLAKRGDPNRLEVDDIDRSELAQQLLSLGLDDVESEGPELLAIIDPEGE